MALQYNYLPVVKTPIDEEGVDGRFDRDYESMGTTVVPTGIEAGQSEGSYLQQDGTPVAKGTDNRKDRQLDRQGEGANETGLEDEGLRQSRLYVDPTTGNSETGADHPIKDVLFAVGTGDDGDPATPTEAAIRAAYGLDEE